MRCNNCLHHLTSCRCPSPTLIMDEADQDSSVLVLSGECEEWNWISMVEGWGGLENANDAKAAA